MTKINYTSTGVELSVVLAIAVDSMLANFAMCSGAKVMAVLIIQILGGNCAY